MLDLCAPPPTSLDPKGSCGLMICIYTAKAWALPGTAHHDRQRIVVIIIIIIIVIVILIIIIIIIIIKPLLKVFNECRSSTGVGELNPHRRSSMNVEV